MEAFTDADWVSSVDDRRSTSSYCTFLWGNLIMWRSKKQVVVRRSSAETKFRALALRICELSWMKSLMSELRMPLMIPMKLYYDNKPAISIAHNAVHHDRIKHVEIDRHFIKEKIEVGLINWSHVSSSNQVADILTKGLTGHQFKEFTSKMGMKDIYRPTWGGV